MAGTPFDLQEGARLGDRIPQVRQWWQCGAALVAATPPPTNEPNLTKPTKTERTNHTHHRHSQQIDGGGKPGFDHCFAVDGYDASASQVDSTATAPGGGQDCDDGVAAKARLFAMLSDAASGRAMEVWGTQPGVQVYTANWLGDGAAHTGVCLETEMFPNAVNDPNHGDQVLLRPGKAYRHFTRHRFYTTK